MTSGRSLLLIADIGGYTEYMRFHRMSLAHAEVNTGRLLEKVIDAVPDFDLIEIEGDAAFLAREADVLDSDTAVALTPTLPWRCTAHSTLSATMSRPTFAHVAVATR
jgi:hypothetical protein